MSDITEGMFLFADEFGSDVGYEGNGFFFGIKILEDSESVELCMTRGGDDYRGFKAIAVSRKTIPKIIRALQSAKDELDERMLDDIKQRTERAA